jgi:hypothetical protein
VQRRTTLLLLFALLVAPGCAELEGIDFGSILAPGVPLDEATVASGLRQALEVGTQRATAELSRPGGFSGDPDLRIPLPAELDRLAGSLRAVGLGPQVDALEESMNRAAEQAASEALPVFASAIGSMSISDAFAILEGPEDAATRYFEARTSEELRARFEPIAEAAMREVGLYTIYEPLVVSYRALPFTKPPVVDLESYVAGETLKALFGELAKEEARIRSDPAARSTDLLRRVFRRPETQSGRPSASASLAVGCRRSKSLASYNSMDASGANRGIISAATS